MRKTVISFLVCILTLFITSSIFAAEIIADSRITEVSVYPDSALISRMATLKLTPGNNQVIFSDIIPELDENSLRVQGATVEGVKILGAQVKKEFLKEEAAEKVKRLSEEIQNLEDENRKLENNKVVLAEEKQFLDSIRLFSDGQIPKDLVTRMPLTKDLEETFKFLGTRLTENYSKVLETEISIREMQKKIGVLRRELAEVSGPSRKLKRSIVVELEATKSATMDLTVSYLVGGASWQPLYDARADFDKSVVELVSYGIVRQATGEDWSDVAISLSTAKPAIGGRMPYVNPWLLRPYQPPVLMERRKAAAYDAYQSMAFDEKAEVCGSLDKELEPPRERYAKAEEKGIAVVYKLPNKASVKADNSEHKLAISAQKLSAKFEYSSYPRAVLSAYLGSRVKNSPDLQLLGGRVNIFLAGDFVGSSGIDNIGPGEEFDLYLGADENVKVKREQVEKKVDETLIAGIPSPTKKTTFKYKLSVENYKTKAANVKLFDAMPVSEDDRIKVKIGNVSIEPKEKDWKDRKGIWLWEFVLAPKEKKEIFYTLTVEHPRDMQVEGL
jgi:uncharacterized protein (TIGR02231 family)